LLDEATAAAEAMAMLHRVSKKKSRKTFLVAADCHPQTIAVVKGRAAPMGFTVEVCAAEAMVFSDDHFGVLLQYPATDGAVVDHGERVSAAHDNGTLVAMACDLLSLTLLTPPGELGADIALGNSQRFGVPMGYGGPHAAFFATHENHKRQIPGRVIGVSRDMQGRRALRMALQTREQHIRREKATSNICTAQVLLAIMAGAYAVYHGPEGLRAIAERVHGLTCVLAAGMKRLGLSLRHDDYFDTLAVETGGQTADEVLSAALASGINLRKLDDSCVGISLDQVTELGDLRPILEALAGKSLDFLVDELTAEVDAGYHGGSRRTSAYLEHPTFHSYRSETEMQRYLRRLESKDLSLTTSMIPLGSCTMKLNAAAQMLPLTWPELGSLHPFVPVDQAEGYAELTSQLSAQLGEMTGLPKVSLQPNSGASGEYAGLLVIRAYHRERGDEHRNICLIPSSAHGTNPASAAMAGLDVVVVRCDELGNIDLDDLKAKAEEHAENLAALMVTYPSTHGVFEEAIKDVCAAIHEHGGQVYLDGANLNAQVGLCRPGDFGGDVCHVNLHKTFAIPHGGGGPGMGPICVAEHLGPYLPSHPVVKTGGEKAIAAISAAPWGSASILGISWMYVRLLGKAGVKRASEIAILNANYVAETLAPHYPVLYRGARGRVAHECIIDIRPLESETGISGEDIAKRLMDYGFHAPTMSFPVAGTLMIEPTESESKYELDRFCDAMTKIRAEIQDVADGKADATNNVLKNAPHPPRLATGSEWPFPYSREQAVYPSESTRMHKFWPPVSRVDNPWGDRNLTCTCPPMEDYAD
jgi:glycine dehydrogenase